MDEATAASIVDEGPPRRDPQLHLDILVMIMEFFDPCTVFGKQHEEAERDLRSFALVCKAWRQAAHPVLFRHLIVLSDPGSELFFLRTAPRPYNVFLDLLRRPPQSCAYTRSFYFYREMENGYELPDRTPLPPLPAFLGHLPNLKNVELYNPPPLCSMDGTIELSSILPAAETRSLDVLTVTRCSIPFTECLFPLLHQFNKVKELDMKHVNYPIASLPPGTLIPNPKFREIELFDVDHCPGLLECLSYMIGNPSIDDDDASLHEASVPVGGDEGLQILSVNVHDDDSLTGLQNMLNQSSATLTSFILSRSRYQEEPKLQPLDLSRCAHIHTLRITHADNAGPLEIALSWIADLLESANVDALVIVQISVSAVYNAPDRNRLSATIPLWMSSLARMDRFLAKRVHPARQASMYIILSTYFDEEPTYSEKSALQAELRHAICAAMPVAHARGWLFMRFTFDVRFPPVPYGLVVG